MHHTITEYQLRLDVQRFLWSVYYIVILGYIIYVGPLSCILGCNRRRDHRRLVHVWQRPFELRSDCQRLVQVWQPLFELHSDSSNLV